MPSYSESLLYGRLRRVVGCYLCLHRFFWATRFLILLLPYFSFWAVRQITLAISSAFKRTLIYRIISYRYRIVSPEWPRRNAHLHTPRGRTLSGRIRSSHLLLGRPGDVFDQEDVQERCQSAAEELDVLGYLYKAWLRDQTGSCALW